MKEIDRLNMGSQFFLNRAWVIILKVSAILLAFFGIVRPVFADGIRPYYATKEYSYQNDFMLDQTETVRNREVSQHFISKGNILTNISLYLVNMDSGLLNIFLEDTNDQVIKTVTINLDTYTVNSWNQIAIDCSNLKRGEEYLIRIQSDHGLDSLLLDSGEKPEIYLECETDQGAINKSLVMGIQQTYRYITFASLMELIFNIFVLSLLMLGLCYSIFQFETLLSVFRHSQHKKGLLYSLYFTLSMVLLFDPIDPEFVKVRDFKRNIGAAFIANIDVSRRINNFYLWFICFAAVLVLIYLLVNYCNRSGFQGEKKKTADFLDQVMILAGLNLLFRCITYFTDQSNMQTVFYYSSAVIKLVIILCIAYLVLRMDRKISAGIYLQMELMAFCTAFPVAIISHREWQSGKLLFGIQVILMLLVLIVIYLFSRQINSKKGQAIVRAGSLMSALVPFATSFYIELINILNQYGIFVTHLRRYYGIGVLIGGAVTVLAAVCIYRGDHSFINWKSWSYTWLVFGITCLNVQIPLQNVYNADIFEGANYSILISDFLNFGDIPIVQHYGGHMMNYVWEGLIYAVLNKDYVGAIFIPYSGYLMAVLAVLFFLLIRKVWNADIALFVTLLFPFYNSWSYFGLGMLICLAVWAYMRKNTYPRAGVVWFAFIWCTLYRLDLGFSFGLACMTALVIYILSNRNWRAAKQLTVTLVIWGLIGGILWTILCVVKGINPISRLLEFLLIGLSNQTWAYEGMGNMNVTLFAWCYIFVPFGMVGSLVYAVFSKKFRQTAGDEIWLLVLILGFAYIMNVPRSLVRHSLVETNYRLILWDAYIYFAVYTAVLVRKKHCLLPVFAALMLCGSALTTTANFTDSTIGDGAVSRLGTFTDKWMLGRFADEDRTKDTPRTYWEELAEIGEPVNRVEWDPTLKSTVETYALVLDTLLNKNETFVDFMNKTFVYSAINRRDPVYVSQSPLLLSGEFTQEEFIRQINGIPIVLMPVDNNRAASYLDGIPNAYRYYKIAEYIYQNYVPICSYDTKYAVWSLPERSREFKEKARLLTKEQEYKIEVGSDERVVLRNCECDIDRTGENLMIFCTGKDPGLAELQRIIDLSSYVGREVRLSIHYHSDTEGLLQLFYTSEKDENYTEEKSVRKNVSEEGTAEFIVPVTEFTRLRLDIPEKSTVSIQSFTVGYPVSYIDYGYDGLVEVEGSDGSRSYSYGNGFHTYSLKYLPNIWAEHDEAINNAVCCNLEDRNGIYVFNRDKVVSSAEGNYLHLKAAYDGQDTGRYYETDDESISATIKVGLYKEGEFIEKYQYGLTIKEGMNDYLIRISSDYNWYIDEINAVSISCDGILHDVQMEILEGD